MDALNAFLLGLVQGFSEFLPISSSGHLVIGQEVLGVEEAGVIFEVALHVGTLLAVLVFYRRRISGLLLGALERDTAVLAYLAKLAVGTVPAVLAVLFAKDFLEGLFEMPWVTGLALIATGFVLMTTRRSLPRAALDEPGWAAAWWIGCAQAAAIVPGISRSGSTVATALALGVRSEAAAEFSFLMSVAAIAGAALLSLPEAGAIDPALRGTILLGVVVAMLSGLVALALFVRFLRTRAFHRFAYYDWIAGTLFLAWLYFR